MNADPKFKFCLPDLLKEKMKQQLLKSKKIAEAKAKRDAAERERIAKYTKDKECYPIKAGDQS